MDAMPLPVDFVIPSINEQGILAEQVRSMTDEQLDERLAFYEKRHNMIREIQLHGNDGRSIRWGGMNVQMFGIARAERERRANLR